MKIGLLTDSLGNLSLTEALDWIAAHAIDSVEISTGGFSPAPHFDLDRLSESEGARKAFLGEIESRGLELTALNCNANMLDPHPERRQTSQDVLLKSIEIAPKLGVSAVCTMSGCPGDPSGSPYPNWVTFPWQPEYIEVLNWQWDKEIGPFWKKAGALASEHGVKIGIEMFPGQAVFNPSTMQRLRDVAGPSVGANFDPSHLFFQGIDPIRVIRAFGKDFIFNVHAKDTYVDPYEMALNGGIDLRSLDRVTERAWGYRTLGHGHGSTWWRQFVTALRAIGYDGPLTIEHEDPLMSSEEGIIKSVEFLQPIVMRTQG